MFDSKSGPRREEPVAAQLEENGSISRFQLTVLTLALCICALMVSLDTVVLATAIPKIASEFGSLDDIGWYGSSYLMTQTALQPGFGKVYNYFDTKLTFSAGIVIFEVGSVVCASSRSSAALVVGRVLAGIGAAALYTGAMNIISLTVPLRRRALYMAFLSGMMGLSNVCGPLLSGALTYRLTWRWCFWINLPCGGVALVVITFLLKKSIYTSSDLSFKKRFRELDLLGTAFLVLCIAPFVLATQWAGKGYSWSDARVFGCIAVSGTMAVLFCVLQWRLGDRGTIPPRLLKQRTILGAAFYSYFLSMGFYIHVYYLPLFFQAVKDATPERSGFDIMPYQASNTLANILAGYLVGITGWYVPLIWLGCAVFTVGSGLLYTVNAGTTLHSLVGYQIVTGIGIGSSVQLPYIAAQVVSNRSDVSSTNAMMLFFHSLGGTISLAVGDSIFMHSLHRSLSTDNPSADTMTIIRAGPGGLRSVVSPGDIDGIIHAYNISVRHTFIVPIVAGCLGFIFSSLLEMRTVSGAKCD